MFVGGLVVGVVGCVIDDFVGWLVGCLICLLVGWLDAWFVGVLVGWLLCWICLFMWLVVRLVGRSVACVCVGRLAA